MLNDRDDLVRSIPIGVGAGGARGARAPPALA